MEGPASVLCLRTCYIKHCKPLRATENPPELGQSHLSRSCSCSHRMVQKRHSNTVSKRALPIIPEYPGFQDIKLSRSYVGIPAFNQLFQDLERGKNSSSQMNDFSRRPSLAHCLGSSQRGSLEGPLATSTAFHDKPLQEYFNERLLELGSYGSKRSNRKTKALGDQSPQRGSRRRSSCSAVLVTGQDREGSCVPANQGSQKGIQWNGQDKIQNVLKLYKTDCLDVLTMHITAPLETFVQKK
ncbi:uncharacterized protein LOC116790243 [Chiroxiphia lanceolata]|uniref:uncharacterized protein LOC116790243 n=1 Tax=Chiroxiphia lanceolata TaxID=296741 RepID=UPI0013CEF6C3|nr:uncharacterized protein LOC116790243 [Chiroxiphia lanceolata]